MWKCIFPDELIGQFDQFSFPPVAWSHFVLRIEYSVAWGREKNRNNRFLCFMHDWTSHVIQNASISVGILPACRVSPKNQKINIFPPSMANDLSFWTNVTVRFCFTRLTNCVSSAHIESIVWIQLHRWEYVLCPGKTFAFHIYAFDENRKNGKCPLIRFIGIHSKKLSSSHPIEMEAMAVLFQCSWRRNAFEAMRKKENKHVMAAIFILKRGYCVWRAYEQERCRRRYIHIMFGAAHHLFCYELAETMWTSARK